MFPFITITEEFKIPTYAMAFFVGLCIAVLIASRRVKPGSAIKSCDILYSTIYGVLGIGAGAKLFFFLSKVPALVTKFHTFIALLKESPMDAGNFLFGGLVFYGGLLGGIFGIYVYCRLYKMPFAELIDDLTPYFPFIHAFGRIGCFCAGCCYGIEYYGPFSVQYPFNELMPELSTVPRFPVQLLEALINLLVFALLIYLSSRKKMVNGRLLGIYGACYAVERFFLEYLRGDSLRGHIGGLSFSQTISIILLPLCLLLAIKGFEMIPHKKNIKESEEINS